MKVAMLEHNKNEFKPFKIEIVVETIEELMDLWLRLVIESDDQDLIEKAKEMFKEETAEDYVNGIIEEDEDYTYNLFLHINDKIKDLGVRTNLGKGVKQ